MTASLEAIEHNAAGYAHPGYAASLSEFGQPLLLPRSGGWLLRRPIAGSAFSDAMGPYPLFVCREWDGLAEDFASLAPEIVSVVVVTDPFADLSPPGTSGAFDRLRPFKDHYVADLDRPPSSFVRPSHRAHARRSLRSVAVEVCETPWLLLDDWVRLFANLSRRHSISGLRSFSRRAFELQLKLPGLVMFRASAQGEVVGLDLWYLQGDVAYGHLAAFSDLGYRLRASYATKWTMLNHFWGRVRWVDLTGSPGTSAREGHGLAAFKSGWSNGTRTAHLGERVLQPAIYDDLVRGRPGRRPEYFPAYRAGELG